MDFTSSKIYKNDPIKLKNYINKEVIINAKGNEFRGIVYTIDPVTESVFLMNKDEKGQISLDLVLGHVINSMEAVSDKEKVVELFEKDVITVDINDKNKLKNWLEKNLIPVQEDGTSLICCSTLTIEPPYTPESCLCNNEIVLNKIQELIKNMPSD